MPARVYECDRSETEGLKKVLAYDPYLDTSIIPQPKGDKDLSKMSDEEKRQDKEREEQVEKSLKELSTSLKGRIIFSRQEYSLRDGASLGLKDNVSYLYLNATDDFLKGAEERFRTEFKTIKRASPEDEQKVINAIKEEEERANAGFGSIFGG
ncbi:MAG: hypothetical protein ACREBH_03955 [Candidatus Micrarchaeaceae archaeon]